MFYVWLLVRQITLCMCPPPQPQPSEKSSGSWFIFALTPEYWIIVQPYLNCFIELVLGFLINLNKTSELVKSLHYLDQ